MIPTKSCKIPKDSKPYSAIKIKDIDIITQVLALSLREPLFFIFLHTHTERERESESNFESWFLSFSILAPRIELRSSNLRASIFTYSAILLGYLFHVWLDVTLPTCMQRSKHINSYLQRFPPTSNTSSIQTFFDAEKQSRKSWFTLLLLLLNRSSGWGQV